ncbi:hypothetical protein [Halomonas urumqiensis]|nr:hypothetical protein [Halomonas urumqiensis]
MKTEKAEVESELSDFEENMRREIEAYMQPAQQSERDNATQSPEQFAEQFAAYQENVGKQADGHGTEGHDAAVTAADESTVTSNGAAAGDSPASQPAKPRSKKAAKKAYTGTAYRTGHLVKLAVRTKPLSMDIVFEHVSSSISKLEAQLEAEKAARKAGYPIIGYLIETTPLNNG